MFLVSGLGAVVLVRTKVSASLPCWAPYLTMAEAIKIACQSYTTDISKLSCCAS